MKSKGCSHAPSGPAGTRPSVLNCSDEPRGGPVGLGRPGAAALQVVRGEERDVGRDARGRRRQGGRRSDGGGLRQSADGQEQEREPDKAAERLHLYSLFATSR